MSADSLKVRYFFSGSRKRFQGEIGVDYPDTQFYGMNHLARFGVTADYREWHNVTESQFLDRVIDFRVKHLLLYPFTRGQDIVFGSSLLYLMAIKRVLWSKARFVLLNIGMTRMLSIGGEQSVRGRFLRWLLGGLDGVVCLARFQKEYLEEHFPFLCGKIFFVPLGVDTHFYQPNFGERESYILSVGRDNGRDYKSVIEAARLMPEREFHIVCSRRNMEGVCDIPKNVKIFYDLSFAELNQKYQEASLLLQVTRTDLKDGSDCSGQTVLLDAMANGLPVVVNRSSYLADYAEDGRDAIIVGSADPAELKIAVESLGSVELREGIAVRARERVEREFSTARMAENLAEVFTRVARNEHG